VAQAHSRERRVFFSAIFYTPTTGLPGQIVAEMELLFQVILKPHLVCLWQVHYWQGTLTGPITCGIWSVLSESIGWRDASLQQLQPGW
jgi:hypothetical protein